MKKLYVIIRINAFGVSYACMKMGEFYNWQSQPVDGSFYDNYDKAVQDLEKLIFCNGEIYSIIEVYK